MTTELLFVYGSCKKGYKNHKFLEGFKFIDKAETEANYLLYDTGPLPVMIQVAVGEGRCIKGEVYQVSESFLNSFDKRFCDGNTQVSSYWLYDRKKIAVKGFKQPVYSYIYKYGVDRFLDCGQSWPRT